MVCHLINYRVKVTGRLFICCIGAEDVKHTFIYMLECKEEGTHVCESQILDLDQTSVVHTYYLLLKYSIFWKAKLTFQNTHYFGTEVVPKYIQWSFSTSRKGRWYLSIPCASPLDRLHFLDALRTSSVPRHIFDKPSFGKCASQKMWPGNWTS
jgi:hypothetical protein